MTRFPLLVIGAGELGTAILDSIINHPSFDVQNTPVSLLLRNESLHSTKPEKVALVEQYRKHGIAFKSGNIDEDDLKTLTALFQPYTTVIQAAGMTSPPGTMTKITQAVLDAGVSFYIPWQHGVDYDVIGREGGQGLFSEQVEIREMLRAQNKTHWTIISCGIFMTFLFEEFWGVVTKVDEGTLKVTALNSWDDMITTTTPKDIGRCTAELVMRSDPWKDKPTYIAGDTLSYKDFADTVEKESGQKVVRDVWPLPYLMGESTKNPEDKLKKYRVVFSEGRGLSWPKENTWNVEKGLVMEDVATWVRRRWSQSDTI